MTTYSNRADLSFYIKFSFTILIFLFSYLAAASQKRIPDDYCISIDEMKLFKSINDLRTDYDKPELKLSSSLSYVAKLHVNDLLNNHPDTSICGLSSWSKNGEWRACCYNSYVLDEECMWDKPKELTSYPYRAYELVTYFEDEYTTDSVIKLWSGTRQLIDMILTRGKYEQKKWVCFGVGINDHYVSVWFGQRTDKAPVPAVCDTTYNVYETDSTAASIDSEGFFYLVYGSFENIADAKEALKRYKKNSFPEAGILSKDNLNRIYLGKFNNLKAAMYAKQSLPYTYREAWILKE